MVYNIFMASTAVLVMGRAPPISAYFVEVWNKQCPRVKLKKILRFTKCDHCVLACESLDAERRKGGPGWLSPQMAVVKQNLDDHYEVWFAILFLLLVCD